MIIYNNTFLSLTPKIENKVKKNNFRFFLGGLLGILALNISCKEIHDRLIYNDWIIKSIKYQNERNLILDFASNSLNFSKNKESCVVPITFQEDFHSCNAFSGYFKEGGKEYIYFYNTDNRFFKDTFEIIVVDKNNINLVNKNKIVKLIDARVGWNPDNYFKGIE